MEEKTKKEKNGKNSCIADARAKIMAEIVATNIVASQPTATPTARANIPHPIRNTEFKTLVFIS